MPYPWTTDELEDWCTLDLETWCDESLDGPVVNYYCVAADYFVASAVGDTFVASAVGDNFVAGAIAGEAQQC